ncbi:MAG: hypothetical protein C0402_13300 [Thermodesulfovibrio sp.]|nr:hypothetical protein [Thermodesulfovibrio sp.]
MTSGIPLQPEELLSRLKRTNPWHIALGCFLFVLLIFIAVRASDKYRWSDWGFGDAQTMLSLKQWEEGGWFANYFLFAPQGYAKVCQLFDDPQLRHHAHGTCPGSSPRIGPRFLYTHYPAGYLVPYAVLFRVGLDSLFAVRMLSVLFSIAALVLMYVVFAKITNPGVSFIAVLFYGLTPTFLGYADTLANQPLDDLLRFGFMLAIVMSTRAESELHRHRWLITAWVAEFMLSLSSFDSVFFLYVWLVGWDIIDRQGFRLKRYLLFSLAPLTAHGLQFMQNVWYLGWQDAAIDIKDAFLLKNAADASYNSGQGRLDVIFGTLPILFGNLYSPLTFIAILAGMYLVYALLLRNTDDRTMPSVLLLLLLFVCGMAFVLILPHAARMPYESRQMIPFVALLVGGVTYSFGWEFRRSLLPGAEGPSSRLETIRKFARPLYLLLSAVVILVFWYRFMLNEREPVYYIPDEQTDARFAYEIETMNKFDLMRYRNLRADVLVAEELRRLKTTYEPVIFSINGFQMFWDPKYVPGYPQIMPITEYYTGSRPVLCFDTRQGLVDDLITLIGKSPSRFTPLLVSTDAGTLREIADELSRRGFLSGFPSGVLSVRDKAVLDLTEYIRWRVDQK